MTDPLPAELEAVRVAAAPLVERFASAGHRLYLVGGMVRDHHLGRLHSTQDLDATTDARPDQIKALLSGLATAMWTQGERFGTIGCVVDGRTWEITTHRAEAYDESSRKPEVVFGDRIEDDLARRDFTVNAMAVDLADGSIIDPHDGVTDLDEGVLRTPLDPAISFSEDPLRMLRAARFHADYDLEPTTGLLAAIGALVDRMEIVSSERIRDELQKLLLLDDPTPGLAVLFETGLAAKVLPAMGDDVELIGRRISSVPPDPAMRWAAALLDGGVDPADLRALVFSRRLADETMWFASAPLLAQIGAPAATEGVVRRAAAGAPPARKLEDQLEFIAGVRVAHDLPPEPVEQWRTMLERLRSTEPDLDDPEPLLRGDEVGVLLGLDPGPDIGVAMRWLQDLRFDMGPVDPAEARRHLAAWWPHREKA